MTQSEIDAIQQAHLNIERLKRVYEVQMSNLNYVRNKLILNCDHRNPDGSSAIDDDDCTICLCQADGPRPIR